MKRPKVHRCAICNRPLSSDTPTFTQGFGFVGPECAKKVALKIQQLEGLKMGDLMEGKTFQFERSSDGVGYTPSSAIVETARVLHSHGLKFSSWPGGVAGTFVVTVGGAA